MKVIERLFNRVYSSDWNPFYQSGATAAFLLLVAAVSGIYLLLFYDVSDPHGSVVSLHQQQLAGRWIRSLHRYSSDAAVVAILVHIWKMWTTSRTWGRRARAWCSGWILLLGVLGCGWTGLILVWDQQSYLLVTEMARALDSLPIFSEPLGQFFADRRVDHSFFFAILFLHVAVPLGLCALYLLHVSGVARPTHQPPRPLRLHLLLVLFLLAAVLPASPLVEADPLQLPGRLALDLFYLPWIPLTRALPGWCFWLLSLLLAGGVLSVPWWTRPKESLPKSWVDWNSCTGCTTCTLDCPYQAIAMVPRTGPTSEDGRHSTHVALVDPDLCVSCGICAGSCAPMGIGPEGGRGRQQLENVKNWFQEHQPEGKLVAVGCRNLAVNLEHSVVFPVECAGAVHTSVLEYLLRRGATGVLLLTCPARDCWNREGPKWAEQRIYHGREAELQDRVDRRRIRMSTFGPGEESRIAELIHRFQLDLEKLNETEPEEAPYLELICEEKPVDV